MTDYEQALRQIELLMDTATPGSPAETMLDALVTQVEAYEAVHCPIDPPDPIGALEHYLDRKRLERKDLVPYIGAIDRVHEVMERRRRLTPAMIARLSPVTGIPSSTLAQPCELR